MRRAALIALVVGCPGCLHPPPCEPAGLCLTATPVVLRPVDQALGAADIDGDGHLDLVSVGGPGAALRRGRGDGTLAAPLVWTLPADAVDLALGDLDGDGAPELVTTLPSRQSLAWLRGAVGGWDPAPRELDVGADVGVLLAADMNGDGADELIASERDRGRLHLWMGAAAGPSTPRYVELGGEAIALVTGRFRGDGGPQLAAAIPVLGEVARFEFSPSVGLERAGTAWAAGFPASLATADIDEDGDDDLAALDTLDRTLWVGLGDGAGGWHDEYTWPLAETSRRVFARRGPAGPELGVIRGDGHGVTLIDPFTGVARIEAVAAGPVQDLVVGDFAAGGSEELVYLHEKVAMAKDIAGFRAQPRWMAPAAGATGQVAVLDLDGDDVPELVVEDPSQPALVVFAGAGSQYVELTRYPLPGPPHGLRPLPRADGGADLVWWQSATFGTPSPLGVLTYVPGEGLAEVATVALDEPILDIVAADLDDDGWADLAVTVRLAGEDANDALVLVTRAPGALTIGPRLLEGEPIESVVAAQIDGVGGEDLWVLGGWDVWSVLGPLDAPTPLESRVWIGHGEVFVAADLNGDAQPDLIACSGYGVEVAYAHPDGTTDPPVAIASTPCERLTPCDLDADGELELVIERRIDDARRNAVEVLRADALGWLTAGAFADAPDLEQTVTACQGQQLLQWSGSPHGATLREVVAGPALFEARLAGQFVLPVLAADLDGDGLDDLFTHDVRTLALALADGEGGYQGMRSLAMPLTGGYVVELGTIELDGRPGRELLARIKQVGLDDSSTVVWSLREGELVVLGPLASGFTTIGDFDGDGRDDLFIAGESPRLVGLGAEGTTITRTLALDAAMFAALDESRAADIDGDGRDDLLLRREAGSSGGVEVLRSVGDGFEAPRTWPLAAWVDLDNIGLGDADGDGATDLVHFGERTLTIARGDGEGGMLAVSHHPVAIESFTRGPPLVEDLDGDARAEVVLLARYAPALHVIRPDSPDEASVPWPLAAEGDAIVRVQLTRDESAWVVTGDQGAILLTAGGGR